MILFFIFISIAIFHIWGDRSRIRELYSSAITGSYVRLIMQYVGSEQLKLWEYKDLPLPMSDDMQIPFSLDFTVYPIAAYLFMQYMPASLNKKVLYYLIWVSGAVGLEMILVWSDHIVLNEWKHGYSFFFFIIWAILVEWQYRVFRKWWSR
jgi:hypothetical protein